LKLRMFVELGSMFGRESGWLYIGIYSLMILFFSYFWVATQFNELQVADDLKKLGHVSPAIEKKLNDLGIFHYSQIAEFTSEAAHNVGEEVGLPGRVQGWIAKAKELTAE